MTSNSWDDMIDGGTLGVDAGVEMSSSLPPESGD